MAAAGLTTQGSDLTCQQYSDFSTRRVKLLATHMLALCSALNTKNALLLHGIPWNCSSHRNWRTQSSMEFHGTALVIEIGALLVPWNSMALLVSAKLAHSKFHGITRVSEIGALQVPWNSMEFHGTARVIEIGAPKVPWNFMELLLSSKLAHY